MTDVARQNRPESLSDDRHFLAEFKITEFFGRVLPILELDDSHFLELVTEPFVVAVEQPELLAVRHNLGKQHLLEQET